MRLLTSNSCPQSALPRHRAYCQAVPQSDRTGDSANPTQSVAIYKCALTSTSRSTAFFLPRSRPPPFFVLFEMLSLSFVPLVGAILPSFLFPAVHSKPASFSVSVPGGGAKFVDGALTADNVGVSTSDNTLVCQIQVIIIGPPLTVHYSTPPKSLWEGSV